MPGTPRYGWHIPDPELVIPDVPYDMEQQGVDIEATVGGIDDRLTAVETARKGPDVAATACLRGDYAGQPLKHWGGKASVTLNASSIGTIAWPAGIFTGGLLAVTLTSINDLITQLRVVTAPDNNSVQIVGRNNTGGGAGAVTFDLLYAVLGW